MGKRAHTYSSEGTSQVFLQGLFWFQTSDNTLVFWTGRQTEARDGGHGERWQSALQEPGGDGMEARG